MIKTTKLKTNPVPKELPPGWELDQQALIQGNFKAVKPDEGLQTMTFPTGKEARLAAHEIEAGKQNGLLGMAPKGLTSERQREMNPWPFQGDGEEEDEGFHPGFPPNFDPERAEKGLAQETPAAANDLPKIFMIPVDQIVPWQAGQMRKNFDPVKLQELADSIEEKGVLQPILLRSYYDDDDDGKLYELIAGERRWRASILAKQERIPAIVLRLTDKEAIEVQVVENLQRADLSPIEEAEGYKRLLDEHGYTAESLAGKLAKSKSYVYGRLKLCNLPAAALDALAKGELPATVGELIGRLPSMEMREKFWERNYGELGQEWFDAPSFRDVKDEIERRYMRELKSAPWNKNDAKLHPEAGSCKDCPKRTGNNRVEYPDARADMCADTDCFERKMEVHLERQVEKAKSSGAKVLSEKESKKLFDNAGGSAWLNFNAKQKYVQLEDQPSGDKEDRSYKQLLEGHLEPVVAIDPQGKAHLLAPRAEAEKILKDQYKINARSSSNTDSYKASEKKRQDEKKIRQATAAEIVERVLAGAPYDHLADVAFQRLVAKFLIGDGDADVARAIAKRRGIEYDQAHVRGSVAKIVDGLSDADLPGMIVEWLIQRELNWWAQWGSDRGDKFPLCGYFDLKPNVVKNQVAAKAKVAKKQPKPKVKADATA